jgi:hypothetical protein
MLEYLVFSLFLGISCLLVVLILKKLYLTLYFNFILDKKDFYSFLSFLNNFENINNGGCGLAAYLLYLYFNCEIFCLKDPNDCYKNNKKNIPFSSKHVFVKYMKKYYDSDGEIIGVNSKKCFRMKPELLKQSITIPDYWNNSFKYRKLLLTFINNTK